MPKKSPYSPPDFSPQRVKLLGFFWIFLFIIAFFRAFMIQIAPNKAENLSHLALNQYHDTVTIDPERGSIKDRKGENLAISLKKPSLYINPRIFKPRPAELKALLNIVPELSPSKIMKAGASKSYFAWIYKGLNAEQGQNIEALNIRGLYLSQEYRRFYPGGSLAGQVLGLVGDDQAGLAGLEYKFDQLLRKPPTRQLTTKDGKGRALSLEASNPALDPQSLDLILSLDLAIQEIADEALQNALQKSGAKSAFALVSDPHSGRILALANAPLFDPNQGRTAAPKDYKNFALTDLLEPGSIVKPMVLAKALDLNLLSPSTLINTHKGLLREDGFKIHDEHPEDFQTAADVIIHSSNIGIYEIAKKLGPQGLLMAYQSFGMGSQELHLDFPGQAYGKISPAAQWKNVRFANIAFGQGFYSNAIELVQAYGAIANGGLLYRPILAERLEDAGGKTTYVQNPEVIRRVIKGSTAEKMKEILRLSVTKGTGIRAKMVDYSSAGKTGTAEKIDPVTKGYSSYKRLLSFIGFAPAKDPFLVIMVVIDEPKQRPFYGGYWAAPVFKEIAERSLRYLNVAPDLSDSLTLAQKEE